MYDKVLIEANEIRFARWNVKWEAKRAIKKPDGSETVFTVPRVEWGVTDDKKNELLARLAGQGLAYTVQILEIPAELQKFEGQEWYGSRGEALKLINSDPVYLIDELKKKLAEGDYKHIRQAREREVIANGAGICQQLTLSDAAYLEFCKAQEILVQKIRELEAELVL